MEAELGFRIRLPSGCTLTRAAKPFDGLRTPLDATWLGCEHDSGKLELWVVEHHRVAVYGVEVLVDFIRALPERMPTYDPLAAELRYWRLVDGSLAYMSYVWVRCGHVFHVFARGELGEDFPRTLASRLDEEFSARTCAG